MAKRLSKARKKILCKHEAGHAVVVIHQGYKVTAIVRDGRGLVFGGHRDPLSGVAGAVGQNLWILDSEGVSAFMEIWKSTGDEVIIGLSKTDVPPYQDWDKREALIAEAYAIIIQYRELHQEISDALYADGIWSNQDEVERQRSIRCFDYVLW